MKEIGLPRPHIIIDDFFPSVINKNILEEATTLELNKGTILINNKEEISDIKKVMNLNLNSHFKNREESKILSAFDQKMWSSEMMDIYSNARYPIFQTLLKTKKDVIHLGRYGDGDYYKWHNDVLNKQPNFYITMNYMFCQEPKKFEGGDFQLRYGEEITTISFKNNRLIIFPANTDHRVTTVKMKEKNITDSRYTIQYWCF